MCKKRPWSGFRIALLGALGLISTIIFPLIYLFWDPCGHLLTTWVVQRHSALRPSRFRADGTFKIVQITDLHITCFPDTGYLGLATIHAVLDAEDPDFVAFTGDICDGSLWISCQSQSNQASIMRAAFSIAESREIPWAFLYGNWDRAPEAAWTGIEANEFITQNFVHTWNRLSPSGVDGDSVFDIPILPPSPSTLRMPWFVLYFFDTHANEGCMGVRGTGCLYPSEVEWYNRTSANYRSRNAGKAVPAFGFLHIPLPEYKNAWNLASPTYGHLDEALEPKGAGISCVLNSSRLFSVALANGDIRGFTCGHNHDNDFRGVHKGVNLMYGRKSGFGSYGPPRSWGTGRNGARVIELRRDEDSGSISVSSWIRSADGTKMLEDEAKAPNQRRKQTHCNHGS